jgi:hypothetical protein
MYATSGMERKMTDTNDNGPNFKRVTLIADERSDAVIEVENLIGGYTDADILCVLMTTPLSTRFTQSKTSANGRSLWQSLSRNSIEKNMVVEIIAAKD